MREVSCMAPMISSAGGSLAFGATASVGLRDSMLRMLPPKAMVPLLALFCLCRSGRKWTSS